MTPDQQRQAMKLYNGYKTTGREFRELAASMGLSISELCTKCWHVEKIARDKLERETIKPTRIVDRSNR